MYLLQRQTVERAKLAFLTDKSGVASDSVNNNKQSDHLVMMVAYRKWEKILREVVTYCKSPIKPLSLQGKPKYSN